MCTHLGTENLFVTSSFGQISNFHLLCLFRTKGSLKNSQKMANQNLKFSIYINFGIKNSLVNKLSAILRHLRAKRVA